MRFLNHAAGSHANVTMDPVYVDGIWHLVARTACAVVAGEQLLFDCEPPRVKRSWSVTLNHVEPSWSWPRSSSSVCQIPSHTLASSYFYCASPQMGSSIGRGARSSRAPLVVSRGRCRIL
jgi:hypothetical protein